MATKLRDDKSILLIYPYTAEDHQMMTNFSGTVEITPVEEFAIHSRIESKDPGLIAFSQAVADTASKFDLTIMKHIDPFQRVLCGTEKGVTDAQAHIKSLGYSADIAHQRQIEQTKALHDADKLIKPQDPFDDDDGGPQGGGAGGYH